MSAGIDLWISLAGIVLAMLSTIGALWAYLERKLERRIVDVENRSHTRWSEFAVEKRDIQIAIGACVRREEIADLRRAIDRLSDRIDDLIVRQQQPA